MLTELELQVLLAIGRGAAHGYAIGKDIEERTGGRIDPTTGALYQAIKRLSESGLIEQAEPPEAGDSDARRKYVALTAVGRSSLADEIRRLERLVQTARDRDLYPGKARS